jgi:hypothetical protein
LASADESSFNSSLNEVYEPNWREEISAKTEDNGNQILIKNMVLPRMKEVFKRTKLSSIFDGLEFDEHGQGIEEWLSKKMSINKLDDKDVEALRVWLKILSNNYREETAVRAAEALAGRILKEYLPENFDVGWMLQNMYQGLADLEGKENHTYEPKLAELKAMTRPAVESWITDDPLHYLSLNSWAPSFFEENQRITFLRKAMRKAQEVGIKADIEQVLKEQKPLILC